MITALVFAVLLGVLSWRAGAATWLVGAAVIVAAAAVVVAIVFARAVGEGRL